MNARTALGLGLGVLLILLLALPVGADKMPSVYKVNATLNCSPIRVTAVYEQGWGIEPTAEGVCRGYITNPTNVSLTPNGQTSILNSSTLRVRFLGHFRWLLMWKITHILLGQLSLLNCASISDIML
ncbi:hypothetical protein [Thermococcus henrietii]|uniref:hypothetical protein n=1 Tax=Thermococcus henrietii TaxID=2016361 RepID=UPI001314878E|nr:hypothetical protein [Thermococcus henrietii]